MSTPNTAATTLSPLSPKESLFLMSSQHTAAVDMVALASATDAPFDSEVPFADLGNEAIVTIESASPRGNTGTPLSHTSTAISSPASQATPSAADLESFFALDANFLALATSSTPSMSSSASSSSTATQTAVDTVSPMALKLESPLLSPLTVPAATATATRGTATKTAVKRARTSNSNSGTTSTTTAPRKRSQDPADKEARARERVLRNRAAAQESRDKKRKYVAEIEASNAQLQEENSHLLKRLKTVEEDNQALSKRLETLTAQFEKMQQQLTMSGIQQTPGVGFCQSAVLAKKDGTSFPTNSPQQKLAPPPKRNLSRTPFLNMSKTLSMTIPSAATTKRRSRAAAPYPQRQATCQSFEEICSRPFRLNSDKTLTLSSSTPACSLRQGASAEATTQLILQLLLPQLMLTSLTLFWISTGAHSNSSSNSTTSNFFLSFLQHQQWLNPQHPSSKGVVGDGKSCKAAPTMHPTSMTTPMIRVSKDVINSLSPACVQEILTEYRQGRQEAARRLLLKVLLAGARQQS